jgi:membrane associated rhomboid family serine protease
MIPLKDTVPAQRFPLVNTFLIGINVLVFLFQSMLSPADLESVIRTLGLVASWITLLSSMFLHGGWWHLISNMLALYIFGDNVEDRLGHFRYVLFYVASGVAAGLAHLLAYTGSDIPTVGASGAIAGVLGAYLLLYPNARVITIVPVFYFIRLVEVPAVIYLGFWFISQLFNGVFALAAADVFQGAGVAWWAHIGGFLFGLGTVRLICPAPCRTYADQYRPW